MNDLRFLVIEDTGPRTVNLQSAMTSLFGLEVEVDQVRDLGQLLTGIDADDLATYAACFIDFHLDSDKTPGYQHWPALTYEDPSGQTRQVRPTTGMAALLHIRSLLDSVEYAAARKRFLVTASQTTRAWSGRNPETRTFAFVEAKDWTSRLFAASAKKWFNSEYVNAQATIDSLKAMLADPTKLSRIHTSALVAGAADALDGMLRTDPTRRKRFFADDAHPSGYDWYAIYLNHGGKSNFSHQAVRDAAHKIASLQVVARKLAPAQYEAIMDELQENLTAFRQAFDENADAFPSWKLRNRFDPMRDFLMDSALFWTEGDVRAAFEDYRRRHPEDDS